MSFLSTNLSLTLMFFLGIIKMMERNYLKKSLRTEEKIKKSNIQSETVVEAKQRIHSVGSNGII